MICAISQLTLTLLVAMNATYHFISDSILKKKWFPPVSACFCLFSVPIRPVKHDKSLTGRLGLLAMPRAMADAGLISGLALMGAEPKWGRFQMAVREELVVQLMKSGSSLLGSKYCPTVCRSCAVETTN